MLLIARLTKVFMHLQCKIYVLAMYVYLLIKIQLHVCINLCAVWILWPADICSSYTSRTVPWFNMKSLQQLSNLSGWMERKVPYCQGENKCFETLYAYYIWRSPSNTFLTVGSSCTWFYNFSVLNKGRLEAARVIWNFLKTSIQSVLMDPITTNLESHMWLR